MRPGEGAALPVVKRLIPKADGTTSVEASVDLDQAPVPQRRYFADTACLVVDESRTQVLFGQRKVTGNGLRSMVVVSVSPDAIRQLLNSSESFIPSVFGFVERNSLPPIKLEMVSEEPPQTVAVVANIIAAAFANREACLDLYHVSAWSMRALQNGDELGVDPIMRVDLSTSLLASLITELVALEKRLPKEAT